MFLSKTDLKNKIYGYQISDITEDDEFIVQQACNAAVQECRSYLTPNNKKEWVDGRIKYDVDAIFSKTGNQRNSLILNACITIAKWHIIELSNVDILYDQAKERYDRTIKFLNQLAKGEITMDSLPTLPEPESADDDGINPFTYGSRPKFNHE